jgi:hypothetical protein
MHPVLQPCLLGCLIMVPCRRPTQLAVGMAGVEEKQERVQKKQNKVSFKYGAASQTGWGRAWGWRAGGVQITYSCQLQTGAGMFHSTSDPRQFRSATTNQQCKSRSSRAGHLHCPVCSTATAKSLNNGVARVMQGAVQIPTPECSQGPHQYADYSLLSSMPNLSE